MLIDLTGIIVLLLVMFALFGFGGMCDTANRQRKHTYREWNEAQRKSHREVD